MMREGKQYDSHPVSFNIGLNSVYGWHGWGGIQNEEHIRKLIEHNTTPYPCSCTGCGAELMRPKTAHWHAKCDNCKKEKTKVSDADYYRRVTKPRRDLIRRKNNEHV